MLTKRIIPCLDVDRGRVVKGVSFVDIRDAGDPAELAAFYDREGADELVFLDITASSDSREIMMDVLKQVSERVFIPLTVGGGVRSVEDVRGLLEAGADKVSLNTAAVRDPRTNRGGVGPLRMPVHRRSDGREASRPRFGGCLLERLRRRPPTPVLPWTKDSVWEVYTHGGRRPTPVSTPSGGPYAPQISAPASCWSPAWIPTGSRPGMTWSCSARYPRAVAGPGHRERRRGRGRAPLRGRERGEGRRGPGGQHLPLRQA